MQLVLSCRAHAKEDFNASSILSAEPMVKAILQAARHCIPIKPHEIDAEKVQSGMSAAVCASVDASLGLHLNLTPHLTPPGNP
jgi:hypothetical protein